MVLLNDFKRQWADVGEAAGKVFAQFGASGWYVLGQGVTQFEEQLSNFWDMPNAIGVANGLDAIEIALRALGLQPGQAVLTTPLSAFATTLAIIRADGSPVFCDVTPSGLLDLDKAESLLAQHPDIRFLLPVHLYGFALDQSHLLHLRNAFQLQMVEDCAQSIGNGSGHVGQFAATSFYPTKNLGAFGDAGALLTADASLAAKARTLRDYGQSAKYQHSELGLNSRLDELHAMLLGQVLLPKLPQWTARRRAIAAQYTQAITNPHVRLVTDPSPRSSCWHLFPVLVAPARKPDLQAWCKTNGVQTAEHYPQPIHLQPAMTQTAWRALTTLTNAEIFCRSQLSLPIHPYLTDEEVQQVITTVNNWPG